MTQPTTSKSHSKRSPWARVGDVVLNILAIGGVICIVLVACAFVFNITLIMFKTGSMSPAIPTGALAVVRQIPADTVEVGDVVTVDREGNLPVTHRVVAAETIPETGITVLEMKGDANADSDPGLYQVTEVRKVLWSMPGLARVIVYFSNPYVLGAITLSMSGLVVAVFWPRERKNSNQKGSRPNP